MGPALTSLSFKLPWNGQTEVLQSMETVKLSSRDAQVFMDTLANPPEPNKALLDAVRVHDRLVDSRY